MKPQRTLLLLGSGLEQIEALRIARELGYRTVAFDQHAKAPGRWIADDFRTVDLKNSDELIKNAQAARPDGVFVHAAELAVEAAQVAEALDLPGLPVHTAQAATNKRLRIQCLAAHGLRTPRFEILSAAASLDDWHEQLAEMAYPFVLKPTNQAGARGVERISGPDHLRRYFDDRHAFTSEAFVGEELLVGIQLSSETVRIENRTRHTALALRHYDTTDQYAPFFIEDGHSVPFGLPAPIRAEVDRVIDEAFTALEISSGVLKGDLLIDAKSQVYILEMAARTSGGRFADTVVPLSTGVNILYPLIEMAMNDPFTADWFTPDREVGVSQRFFLHSEHARVDRWPALRRLVGRPGVAEWQIDEARFRSGDLPKIESHRDRFGYVICTGRTRQEADDLARDITSSFSDQIRLQPFPKAEQR